MKTSIKIIKWIGITLFSVILIFVLTVFLRQNRTFDAPYPDIQASTDSAVVAWGKYLVYGPAHCAHCHAPMSELARTDRGEEVPLSGGLDFVLPIGTIYSPNITNDPETGIGNFTDQEIARSLRYGVGKNGRAIFDFMPFYDLSDDDLTSVISFLRTQPAVVNKRPDHSFNFIGKAIGAFIIEPMGDGDVPPPVPIGETVEYGRYLSESVANCRGCHTPRNLQTGAFIGPDYSGNTAFEVIDENGRVIPGKHIVTPNISPDPDTGIMTDWTQEDFMARFRTGRIIGGSPMPWGPFSRMTDMELNALYKFLRSVKPIKQAIPDGIQDGDPPV